MKTDLGLAPTRHGRALMTLAGFAVMLLLPAPDTAARDKSLLVPESFATPTAEELALESLPAAPGAPALVLLEACQIEYTITKKQHCRYVRRVKILDQAGASRFGTFSWETPSHARLDQAAARTVLPDGTVLDSGDNLRVDRGSGKEGGLVQVAFARATPGSIVEVRIEYTRDWLGLDPWPLEQEIPVRESRLVVAPLVSYTLAGVVLQPDGRVEPAPARDATLAAQVWSFRDLAPIGDEPLSPPASSLGRRLCVDVAAIKMSDYRADLTTSWSGFIDWQRRGWNAFASHADAAKELAKATCVGKTGVRERARAIHDVLADRVRVNQCTAFLSDRPPKAILAGGVATSAELAAVAFAMLRAQDIEASPALLAGRGTLAMAPQPVTDQFTDAALIVHDPRGDFVFAPHLPFPVREVPSAISGAIAIVLDKDGAAPSQLPMSAPDENRIVWKTEAMLAANGQLTADVAVTLTADLASDLRKSLAGLGDAARETTLRESLLASLGKAHVASSSVEGLEGSANVIVHARIEGLTAATLAGSRLIITELPGPRVELSDWAAPARKYPIDLGQPMELESEVLLSLAEGVRVDELPVDASRVEDGVGAWKVLVRRRDDGRLSILRIQRNERALYPAAAWPQLRALFHGLSEAETRPLVANDVGARRMPRPPP